MDTEAQGPTGEGHFFRYQSLSSTRNSENRVIPKQAKIILARGMAKEREREMSGTFLCRTPKKAFYLILAAVERLIRRSTVLHLGKRSWNSPRERSWNRPVPELGLGTEAFDRSISRNISGTLGL